MLTTLLPPTSGRATVAGLDIVKDAPRIREQIGVALQEAGLDDLQTGRETLTLQARLYRVPARDVASQVDRLLEIVDLQEAADRRVKTYSGGMKRRLDLAAALVHRPRSSFWTSRRRGSTRSAAKRSGATSRNSTETMA